MEARPQTNSHQIYKCSNEHYDRWCMQMRVIFKFQDVIEIVNDNLPTLESNATDTQNVIHRESGRKDEKCLFLIH